MEELGLIYCPAVKPNETTYIINPKTPKEMKDGFEADGYPCTMKEMKQIRKWMDTAPRGCSDPIEDQIATFVCRSLQMEKENIEIGFKVLRAFLAKKINADISDLLETKFSFTDEDGKEISFKMLTELGKQFKDGTFKDGLKYGNTTYKWVD